MVIRENIKKKFALISVYDKKKLKYLCVNLIKNKYSLISTGSTGDKIRSMGFKCTDISKITKFKEMLDGRIKTINPLIYASLLYVRKNEKHKKQFLSLKIPEISVVVVNLYPFEKYKNNNKIDNSIEMIDVGGPSLLRAASKNFESITSVIDTDDYKKLIKNIQKNNGSTDINFRRRMAQKVFRKTSNYDRIIEKWFNEFEK